MSITDEQVEAAAKAIIATAFDPDEAPDWREYEPHARAALAAAQAGNNADIKRLNKQLSVLSGEYRKLSDEAEKLRAALAAAQAGEPESNC